MRPLCFCISFALALALGTSIFSAEEKTRKVDASETVKIFLSGVNKFMEEANQLNNWDIYRGVIEAKAALHLYSKDSPFDENGQKVVGYTKALEERGKNGNLEAAFFDGYLGIGMCKSMISIGVVQATESTCTDPISKIKPFGESGDARAMEILGKLYFEGIVVRPSNFIAADWLIKAANQHLEDGYREGALRSIEVALLATPENAVALALMTEIFEQ